MRTTINLDNELLRQALEYDGNRGLSKSRLLEKALRMLIRREQGRRSFRMRLAEMRADTARDHAAEPRGGARK